LAFFERGSSSEDDSSLLLPDFLFLGAGFFSGFLVGAFLELTFFVGVFFALDGAVLPPFFFDLGSCNDQNADCLSVCNKNLHPPNSKTMLPLHTQKLFKCSSTGDPQVTCPSSMNGLHNAQPMTVPHPTRQCTIK
jgi:hypothetical protein